MLSEVLIREVVIVLISTGIVCPACGTPLELPPLLGGLAIAMALRLQFEHSGLEVNCEQCHRPFKYPPPAAQLPPKPHFDPLGPGLPADSPIEEVAQHDSASVD
jgi:ribosomal protein S27E